MFYSKMKLKLEFKTKVYEEIKQLKSILSNESFGNFSFLKEFLEAVEFGDLMALNKVSHPSLDNRKIESITKYVDNKKPYLDKVVKFLKELPNLENYINLEVKNYYSKKKLEEEVSKEYDFEAIYDNKINIKI